MSLTTTVVVANIRGLPLQRYRFVRNRIRKAIALAGREGVVMFAECAPGNRAKSPIKRNRKRYSDIVKAEARRAGKVVCGGESEIPIVLDTRVWHVTYSGRQLVHKGLAHVSPNRVINKVRAVHCATGTPAEFDAGHPISKGHYPDTTANRRRIPHLDFRRNMLGLYFREEAVLMAESHDAGRLHVFGGDLNDATPPKMHTSQAALNNAGLDHIFAVAAPGKHIAVRRRVRVAKTKQMDHPILAATFTQN